MSGARYLHGIIPVLPTCFDEAGCLDLKSQAALLQYYLRCGVDGLALFGNASEYWSLSPEERKELLKIACREVKESVPLIVSVGGPQGRTVSMQIAEAEDLGAAAILVRPPLLEGQDMESVFAYYAEIARIATVPLIVQDTLLENRSVFSISTYALLARRLDGVKYAKVEVPWTPSRIRGVFEAGAGRLLIFGGMNGQFMIEEWQAGAVGTMSGSDLTPHYLSIWRCCERGALSEAWALFARLLPLIRFELSAGLGISAIKNNLAAEGVIRCPRVRSPTPELDGDAIRYLGFLREFANPLWLAGAS